MVGGVAGWNCSCIRFVCDVRGGGYGAPAPSRGPERDILDEFAMRAGIPGPAAPAPLPRVDSFGSDGGGRSNPRSPATQGALLLQARREGSFEEKVHNVCACARA